MKPTEEKSLPTWLVVLVVGGLIIGTFATVNSGKPVTEFEGKVAPFFQLKKRDGEIAGYTQPGRVQIIDFWATWCPPCVKQTPAIEHIRNTHPEVDVISVNTDDPGPNRDIQIQRFLSRGPWNFPILLDDGSASAIYKITNLPTLVVVGTDGTVVYANSGVKSVAQLEKLIQQGTQ